MLRFNCKPGPLRSQLTRLLTTVNSQQALILAKLYLEPIVRLSQTINTQLVSVYG